jgi:4-hydroxy-3-methylbut-2-enyl diphosphate reductase
MEVSRYARDGLDVVLIGHAGHPEVEGTMGQFDTSFGGAIHLVETPADVDKLKLRDPARVAFVTQTTLSMDDTARVIDALRGKFPAVHGPRKDDICYATQNRQDAVRRLARRCQVLLVVGSRNSSNSNRLRELAESEGAQAHLIDGPDDMQRGWFEGRQAVGVTAGASAPEVLVQLVVARLKEWGGHAASETEGIPENVEFALPKVLRPVSRP